jgi:Uma2 family endonuclease
MTALAIKYDNRKTIPIPDKLVYEEWDGRKLYRKGYKKFLNQTKTIEEIMGCSSLQAAIVSVLLSYLYRNVEDEGYEIMTNEAGLHIALGNNLSSDIILYDSKDFLKYRLDEHYFNVAPKMVIEVDIKIELEEDMDIVDYWTKKTEKLFSFGVEKVVWVFSEDKKIILAEPNKNWTTCDWTKDFELMPNHIINIQKMIDKKGYIV